MRRLFMTADAVGGVWQYAVDLAAALAPLGTRTTLALLGPGPSEAQRRAAEAVPGLRLIETGLPLDWLARDEAAVRYAARSVARLAREDRADVIQLNQPALAAVPMPVPVVAVLHSCLATWWAAAGEGPMPEAFAWQARLTAEGLARADAVACPSHAFAEAAMRAYALPRLPAVVHNGRAPSGVEAQPMRDFAFTAGRLWDHGKDAATLDMAAARLSVPFAAAGPVKGPGGDGVRLAHLEQLGTLDDAAVAERLAARPVFVSAARYEPFGLAVLEAAQAGCALVLPDIPTFRELWGEVATFVAPGDAAGFTAAVEDLIADPDRRVGAGEAARRRAQAFTPLRMAAGMAAIHAAVADRVVAA
ncbi:glycosyl transferase family 1 [Sphingomonas spermidinifaciens]|uniref:Glycosyl transferase family 1 n=1 Tax=Sphingomonas spermidinifaciens TaxID=1141889 RepID=A0A2A4B5Z5_9SPHN|nr:glycosyltransferase family 4 protein [Sphingomonas spermidinifaciens]PCD03500.1 glycosyl transferase family 1 [Sphingomonas spermidinifaciens]